MLAVHASEIPSCIDSMVAFAIVSPLNLSLLILLCQLHVDTQHLNSNAQRIFPNLQIHLIHCVCLLHMLVAAI